MINIVILGDGMSDLPYVIDKNKNKIPQKTPLMEAETPVFDRLAETAEIGLVRTVPEGLKPGSDVANLSVMGYDPTRYYTGRSPLEAISIGIDMKEYDLAVRCNLVTLAPYGDGMFCDKTMEDYSAGEVDSITAHRLIEDLSVYFKQRGFNLLKDFGEETDGFERFEFFGGVSYRNCLIVENGTTGTVYTPPHDISGKVISEHLPRGAYGRQFCKMAEEAHDFLSRHPLNKKRVEEGKRPANAIWLWGEGTKPRLQSFFSLYGKRGAAVSAVDLIKGIAIAAGIKNYEVEGATGNVDTNFLGKAQAVIDAVNDGYDFVYLHIEAADESGHRGERHNKIFSIKKIDETTGVIKDKLDALGVEYSLLILPDHPTPLSTRTHSADPVPYMMYSSTKNLSNGIKKYDEISAENGVRVRSGTELIKRFFE